MYKQVLRTCRWRLWAQFVHMWNCTKRQSRCVFVFCWWCSILHANRCGLPPTHATKRMCRNVCSCPAPTQVCAISFGFLFLVQGSIAMNARDVWNSSLPKLMWTSLRAFVAMHRCSAVLILASAWTNVKAGSVVDLPSQNYKPGVTPEYGFVVCWK